MRGAWAVGHPPPRWLSWHEQSVGSWPWAQPGGDSGTQAHARPRASVTREADKEMEVGQRPPAQR